MKSGFSVQGYHIYLAEETNPGMILSLKLLPLSGYKLIGFCWKGHHGKDSRQVRSTGSEGLVSQDLPITPQPDPVIPKVVENRNVSSKTSYRCNFTVESGLFYEDGTFDLFTRKGKWIFVIFAKNRMYKTLIRPLFFLSSPEKVHHVVVLM